MQHAIRVLFVELVGYRLFWRQSEVGWMDRNGILCEKRVSLFRFSFSLSLRKYVTLMMERENMI